MMYGYGILNNHVPTLKATVMKIGAALSPFLTSLYAVYKGESNANDSLGTYNGTAVGGLTYPAGKSGNAFTFNSGNAYVSLPNSFKLSDSGSNAYSISLWVYLTDATTLGHGLFTNFMQNAGIYHGWMIWYYQNNLYFSRYNGTSTPASTLQYISIPLNAWYNIVVTRKNGSTKLYVNNVLRASDTSTSDTAYTTTHYPLIGARQSYVTPIYDWFLEPTTKVDEVNVWTKELTSTEVTDLYNSGAGKFYPTF